MFKAVLSLVALASAAMASCPTYTTPQLCGTPDIIVDLQTCNSTNLDLGTMPPCCRLQVEQHRKCDSPNATQACRSMEISSGLCPGQDVNNCCFQKQMSMKFYFEFDVTNKTCCSQCRCYGDPHCESFTGAPDTWVLCDARTPKPPSNQVCPMTKKMCLSQLDQNNNVCNWTLPPGQAVSTWNIGMNGSPCVPANGPPGVMDMYSAEGFTISLYMGERSVIKDILIVDGANTYAMSADDCFAAAYSPNVTNPWRTSVSSFQTPPTMPATWLPYTWTWGPVDGEDVLWDITGLQSLITMTVRCTRTVQINNGRRRYGPPRLNVDLTEPLNWQDADQRPNSAGFCPTGKITKEGSTQNTDQITANGWCTTTVDNLDVAQLLCGNATTAPGVQGCIISWCRQPMGPSQPVRVQNEINQCVSDVNTVGWDKTFCATMLLPEPVLASNCVNDANCRVCLSDISDFGWAAAIAKYIGGTGSSGQCVTRADLPPDLAGFCTEGVRVQYYDSAAQTWITQFAIPAGTCLENGYITVTSDTDGPLFQNPIRIIQCSTPTDVCLTNDCAAEIGFSASVELSVQTSEFETVWDLFQAGDLICNPKYWETPTACLGFNPSEMCPCNAPTSNGRRLKELNARRPVP